MFRFHMEQKKSFLTPRNMFGKKSCRVHEGPTGISVKLKLLLLLHCFVLFCFVSINEVSFCFSSCSCGLCTLMQVKG